jgi:hypothetical protein
MKVVFFAVLIIATLLIGGTSIQSVSSQSLATVKVEASPSTPMLAKRSQ